MKRLAFIFVGMVVALTSFAKDFTSGQISLRSDVMQFLKEEGYMPSIDGDGDIKFKSEGDPYYVEISDNNENPYFLRLTRWYNYPDNYSKLVVRLAANEINKYRDVKMTCTDNSIILSCDMFLRSAESFKQVFYRCMQQLQSAGNELPEDYAAAKQELSEGL